MDSTILSLTLCVVFMMLFLFGGMIFMWWMLQKNSENQKELIRESLSLMMQTQTHQSLLLDKSIGVIASADPLAYQAIQAMNSTSPQGLNEEYVGMSEMDEALREAERNGYVANPDDIEGITYDADSIRNLLDQSSGGFLSEQ